MGLTVAIVIRGLKKGIENWTRILMPLLFILLVFLFIQALRLDGFSKAIAFLFTFDLSGVTRDSVLSSVGHSFFTLSLGMGAISTYGSYLNQKEKVVQTSCLVAFLDTFIALVAGIIIFSIVFSFEGLEPQGGPTLMFSTLPTLFSTLPGGYALSIAFFLLVAFAALTSAVSILEIIVAYLEQNLKWSRAKATLVPGTLVYLLGIVCAFDTSLIDVFDVATTNYLLPITGLIVALFVGYKLGKPAIADIVSSTPDSSAGKILAVFLRYVAPIAIVFVFLNYFMKF